ncbi:ABC transporter substrate-binding protein [Bradyrhizobium genosp. P]|uniref:ABC transporter substrate-binding protein n=1 Tax=Bradyrhizobium genosp. P TaxID=83641 RepID=UPI003CF6BF17
MRLSITRRRALAVTASAIATPFILPRQARSANDEGITDTEIKLGSTATYSGPVSAIASYGEAQVAYFKMINDRGGINGRKINFISLDNAFSPPKTIEQTRRLVESDGVFAVAGALGTPTNAAVQKYLNSKKVPNLFFTSGSERFNDPTNYPWIVPLYPSYVAQGAIYARFLLATKPDAKIGVLYENDDLGRDYQRGLKQGLGDKASTMIVAEKSHETTDPTIDSAVISIQAAGADAFLQFTNQRYAAQGIRKVATSNWKPLQIICSNAASIGQTLIPAGVENCKGILSARWEKAPSDPAFANDPGVQEFKRFVSRYMPRYSLDDLNAVPGYNCACAIAEVLKRCGDELTRENLLKHATSLRDLALPMLLNGIKVSNSPTDYAAFHAMELIQFDGEKWVGQGDVIQI